MVVAHQQSQTDTQARATERHLDLFSRWVHHWMLCSHVECLRSPSCLALSKIGHHTRRSDDCPDLPRCMAAIERDVERARALVEDAYHGLLDPARPLHVLVAFTTQKGTPTVNGETRRFERPEILNARPNNAIRTSRVDLYLPDPLTPEAAFKVLYTVAHEIGVHATQQIDLRGAPNGDNDTAFSEGLVEEALYAALERSLSPNPFWRPHKDGCEQRHQEHQGRLRPGNADLHNPHQLSEITRGSALFDRLTIVGQAALDAGVVARANLPSPGGQPSPLSSVQTGRDWARRLVLALNTLPLRGADRTLLFDLLEFKLKASITEDAIRADLADRQSRIVRGERPTPFIVLFTKLNRLVSTPLDPRSRAAVEALVRSNT